MQILECNVGDERFKKTQKLLLYGTCLPDRYPEIFKQFSAERTPVHACLEDLHMDHVGYKLVNIIKYSKIKELTILTIDGSPHCYQLHCLGQDLKRHFITEGEVKISHFVIEKGTLHEISYQAITVARHLHRVQKLLTQKNEN
ncbi:MAG TPA: hypothetical protein VMV49_18160 [Candidatus Deferrimicrobium sp.]|nr:hypothetical protein [Candidatus Deferrimicrobium sp.]